MSDVNKIILQIAQRQNEKRKAIAQLDQDFAVVKKEYTKERKQLVTELEQANNEWETGAVQLDLFVS